METLSFLSSIIYLAYSIKDKGSLIGLSTPIRGRKTKEHELGVELMNQNWKTKLR